jgi:hypothetical protein
MTALKEIAAPHLGRTVKMGRRRPRALGMRLRLKHYLKLPAMPASCDYSAKALPVLRNIYGNDRLGDCVIAGGYHIVGVETGNAGVLFTAADNQIVGDYSAIGGYDPNDPNTDQGCDEETALNFWQNQGFVDGTKICGWLAVDATDQSEVQAAMFLFENLMFGIELPDEWINPFPSTDGFVWDVAGQPDPNNGHAVIGLGYDPSGVQIDSWGLFGTITWPAVAQYAARGVGGQLFVILTPDQLAKGADKAPNGIDWATLVADFNAMGGMAPIPTPIPPTPPDLSPSLADAQVWAAAGLAQNWPK